MSWSESSPLSEAPPGALFLSAEEVQQMIGDFGVQRTIRLMHTEAFPVNSAGSVIVQAVVRASALPAPDL